MNQSIFKGGLMAVAVCLAASCTLHTENKEFSGFADDFSSNELFSQQWKIYADTMPGVVEFVADADSASNSYIVISSEERTHKGISHVITGLTPEKLYRLSARVKTDSVAEGRGAVCYITPEDGQEQPWNASEFVYGTTDWQDVYMDFVPDSLGQAEIVLALGYPWGTYNGGIAKGVAYWDDVKVEETPAELMKTREGKHIELVFDADKVTITDEQLDAWIAKLDSAYESYEQLVGGVPYQGRKIKIITTPGIEPGYWALAGNPILWNSHVKVTDLLEKTVSDNDWGFGIIHEIGHVFSAKNEKQSGNWNWNDEIFANFRMSYALEKCDGIMSQRNVLYKGADVRDYYKMFYDESIGQGKPSKNGDMLHYTFLRIKDKYGWDVYEKAFRALYALGEENDIDSEAPAYDKMMFFLKYVSDAAGEDVVAATYTPEELQLIKEGFEQ